MICCQNLMMMFYFSFGLFLLLVSFHQSHQSNVVLFQAVDSSFFNLWLNWWTLALSFNSIPKGWELHLACFGDDVNNKVIQFHAPGCTQIIAGSLHIRRIYFVKWKAMITAFRLGKDILLVDIDALLIRNPMSILKLNFGDTGRDIVVSRDHGHENLQHALHWSELIISLIPISISIELLWGNWQC